MLSSCFKDGYMIPWLSHSISEDSFSLQFTFVHPSFFWNYSIDILLLVHLLRLSQNQIPANRLRQIYVESEI